MNWTQMVTDVFNNIFENIMSYLASFTLIDAIDILLVTVIVFFVIQLVYRSNAFSVLKGLFILLAVLWLSQIFRLHVLNYILSSTLQVGLLALIILFQPELRKMLGQVGSRGLSGFFNRSEAPHLETDIAGTVEACRTMSWDRTGALIVFERNVKLDDIVKTGTVIDAAITVELLKNIFYPKAPLHDGAVIVQKGRITGAGCMLPLTSNTNLSRDLGMRHRAGIGISENSDAVVVIVSEETGSLSVATGGMLKRHLAPETLEKLLRLELIPQTGEGNTSDKGVKGFVKRLVKKGKRKNEEDKKA